MSPLSGPGNINERFAWQAERIRQGAENNSLSKSEGQELRGDEQALRAQFKGYMADGTLSPDEQKSMNQSLNQESQKIYALKHNDTTGTRTPGINHRLDRQADRIHQGVESGQLTSGEAQALRQEQAQIRQTIGAAKADGAVTGAERSQIKALQDAASKDIYELKHNPFNKYTGAV